MSSESKAAPLPAKGTVDPQKNTVPCEVAQLSERIAKLESVVEELISLQKRYEK